MKKIIFLFVLAPLLFSCNGGGFSSKSPTQPSSPIATPVGCYSNADCSGEEGEICNTFNHECVECQEDSDCSPGEQCSVNHKCVPKPKKALGEACASNSDCASGMCDGEKCIECQTVEDCFCENPVCQNGRCVSNSN